MAIALPAAAVIMHLRDWDMFIAIKTFVVGIVAWGRRGGGRLAVTPPAVVISLSAGWVFHACWSVDLACAVYRAGQSYPSNGHHEVGVRPLPAVISHEKKSALHAGSINAWIIQHGINTTGLVLVVSWFITTRSWSIRMVGGCLYSCSRGEIFGQHEDSLQRRHSSITFFLIKNES